MFTAQQILGSNIAERKELIIGETVGLEDMESALDRTKEVSRVINIFISAYFQLKIQNDLNQARGSILVDNNLAEAFDKEIEIFKPIAISKLQESMPTTDELLRSSKNVYEMSGATKLAFANKATRTLSTTMGLLWERLASISPYAINPEIEFNLKLKGIDLIALNQDTSNVEYQQLKTQQNTLTGSQKGRSVEELSIHDYPVFCACFSNSSWTFNDVNIPRISGTDFWSRIGISYDILLPRVKDLVLTLEEEYVRLL